MTNDGEDKEIPVDENDKYVPVNPIIANQHNDFVDESILLLHFLHKKKTNSEHWVSYLRDFNDNEVKHLILYNWIALSLVREAYADVAAVAVYSFNDKPSRVYYAKNNLNSTNEAHANEFADLVRLLASATISVDEFQTEYFSLMHKNCLPKLIRRVNQLRGSLTFQAKPVKDKDNKLIFTPPQGEQIRNLLKTAIDLNAPQPLRRNRADTDALKLVGDDTKNIFVALLKIFDSMKLCISGKETADMLQNLSAHCWIIGMSGILEEMTRTNGAAQDVIRSAGKLGEYFRGTSRLFVLLSEEKTRESMASFKLFAVPPTSDRHAELCKDWYHVIKTVYSRIKGKALAVAKDKLFSSLHYAATSYSTFEGRFIRHAEIDLIKYLMNQNLAPTVIGISKLSCALCDTWINMINFENEEKWKVSGCHGRIYQWARDVNAGPRTVAAEARVKEFVYRELVEFVTKFIPDGGESPAHPSTLDGEMYYNRIFKLHQ
jgi:OTT_1508-like deaminase